MTEEQEQEEKRQQKQVKRARITRDSVILTFAISAAAFEITLGGARPSVLTFLTGVFLSPLIMRADERNNNRDG